MEYTNPLAPARIFAITSYLIWILLETVFALPAAAQTRVPLQPLAQQVRQVETSLAYLGQPLTPGDEDAINQAIGNANEAAAIEHLEEILDKYTLATVLPISSCSMTLECSATRRCSQTRMMALRLRIALL